MIRAFRTLFVDHPREAGETYLQHAGVAMGMGWRLVGLAGCAFIHAVAPGLHRTTVSNAIARMAQDTGARADQAREGRMRDAGAWDPGL